MNGFLIKCLAILGYPVSHREPFHPKMCATLPAIEPTYHGIYHPIGAFEISPWDISFTFFHQPLFIIEPIFHEGLEVFMFDSEMFEKSLVQGYLGSGF